MEPGEAFRRDVSRETRERLEIYETLLRQRQRRVNLVSAASLPALWTRHFLDSAQLGPLLADDSVCHTVDVGSGAGFPGMVLAILDADRRFSLVEANGKRCAFLREVADATGTQVSVIEGRLEAPEVHAALGPAGTIVARACAPLVDLLGLVFPVLDPIHIVYSRKDAATGASWRRPAAAGNSGSRSSPAARQPRRGY